MMIYRDPGVRYNEITSGDVGRITEVGESVSTAMAALTEAASGLDRGMSAVAGKWSGQAATEFLARARQTNQAVATTNELLGRISASVHGAATAYSFLLGAAGLVYQAWLNRPPNLDETQLAQLATRVDGALLAVADRYERALATSLGALAGSDDSRPGGLLVALKELLLNHDGDGPVIPHTLASGDPDGEWIPQGLAYDSGRDQLLVSYYSGKSDTDSLLAVIDENSGQEVTNVRLGGVPVGFGLSTPAPDHSGGVAVDGDNVWVTSTEGDHSYVYHYSRADIEAASAGETVKADGKYSVGASSYATFSEGKLWVGSFHETHAGTLYSYDVGSDGTVADTPSQAYSTPDRIQGVVVRDGEFIFSQSFGRDNTSSLVTQDRDNPLGYLFTTSRPLPNMAEGIAEVDGEILTVYESGAEEYADGSWPRDRITRTPLEELLGDSGFDVEPSAIDEAVGPIDGAADAIADAAALMSRTQLVAAVLGDVPAAKPFSATVTACIEACGRNLVAGARSVRETADGLVASAATYRRLEDSTSNLFGGIWR